MILQESKEEMESKHSQVRSFINPFIAKNSDYHVASLEAIMFTNAFQTGLIHQTCGTAKFSDESIARINRRKPKENYVSLQRTLIIHGNKMFTNAHKPD